MLKDYNITITLNNSDLIRFTVQATDENEAYDKTMIYVSMASFFYKMETMEIKERS